MSDTVITTGSISGDMDPNWRFDGQDFPQPPLSNDSSSKELPLSGVG